MVLRPKFIIFSKLTLAAEMLREITDEVAHRAIE